MREIRPGVELAHLVPLALSEVYGEMGDTEEAAHFITKAYDQLAALLSDLPDEARRLAWENIPNHKAIHDRWAAHQPQRQRVELPIEQAPVGRPLNPEEVITVEWTVHDPSDEKIEDRIELRRHKILRLLTEAQEAGASPTVAHLADALGSSDATIRRDLAALRSQGIDVTTRGSR